MNLSMIMIAVFLENRILKCINQRHSLNFSLLRRSLVTLPLLLTFSERRRWLKFGSPRTDITEKPIRSISQFACVKSRRLY